MNELGRFGHHPDPAIDFCVEVDAIEGLIADCKAGLVAFTEVEDRTGKALRFNVGGVERAVMAKDRLRAMIVARSDLKSSSPSVPGGAGATERPRPTFTIPMKYSNQDFDEKQALAGWLTDEDRREGRPAPQAGSYSAENWKRAEAEYQAACDAVYRKAVTQ